MAVSRSLAGLFAAILLATTAACDNQGGTDLPGNLPGGQNQDDGGRATPDPGGQDGGDEGQTADEGGAGEDGGGGETREPIGNLIASPDNGLCDFVPGGTTDGRDALQVSFFILLIGANPDDLPGLVKVDGESSTGGTASFRSAVSNQARSVAAIPLSGQDFGAQLTVTITVDTPDEVPETDESDNRITASVRVPSPRPSGAVELPCTLNRA